MQHERRLDQPPTAEEVKKPTADDPPTADDLPTAAEIKEPTVAAEVKNDQPVAAPSAVAATADDNAAEVKDNGPPSAVPSAAIVTIGSLTLALDQATKYLADTFITPGDPVALLPVLQLVNVKNQGAAFGMFSSLGNGFFVPMGVVAIILMTVMLIKGRDGWLGLTLLISGAAGNIIDRIAYGHVRDFIDCYVGQSHWPAFNVADMALTAGIALMLLGTFSPARPDPVRPGAING